MVPPGTALGHLASPCHRIGWWWSGGAGRSKRQRQPDAGHMFGGDLSNESQPACCPTACSEISFSLMNGSRCGVMGKKSREHGLWAQGAEV